MSLDDPSRDPSRDGGPSAAWVLVEAELSRLDADAKELCDAVRAVAAYERARHGGHQGPLEVTWDYAQTSEPTTSGIWIALVDEYGDEVTARPEDVPTEQYVAVWQALTAVAERIDERLRAEIGPGSAALRVAIFLTYTELDDGKPIGPDPATEIATDILRLEYVLPEGRSVVVEKNLSVYDEYAERHL